MIWLYCLMVALGNAEQGAAETIDWMKPSMWTGNFPDGPYPVLAVHGEQGSAKSTLAKVARLLIDPQASPVLAESRSTRDLMVTAANGWLMAYDNICVIPTWLSDSLCRLATGGGWAGGKVRLSQPTAITARRRR